MSIARALAACFLALTALSDIPANAAPRPIAPGRFCLMYEMFGDTGRGPDIRLGFFRMEVVVRRTASGYALSFWNVMPDSQEILGAETDHARLLRDGSLTFDFTDGWDNRGRARVRPSGRVDLVILHRAPMNQIGRNYGTFRLSRAACAAPAFRRTR